MKSLQPNNITKICNKCNVEKNIDEFRSSFDKRIGKDVLRVECKDCEKRYNHEIRSGDRICPKCKSFKKESEFNKLSLHCKDCRSKYGKEKLIEIKNNTDQTDYNNHLSKNSKNNMKRYQKKQDIFDTVDISECYEKYLSILRKNAKSRSTVIEVEYDIDLDFLIQLYKDQNGKCAVTGLDFNLDKGDFIKRPFAPSIDRIDCNKGYVKDNVRLVCLVVNLSLNEFGDIVFTKMCRAFVKNN